MKISFVYAGEESLGIEYLSAVLKREGHSTDLIYDPRLFDDYYVRNACLSRFLDARQRILRTLKASRPDIVAFSVTSLDYTWASDLARTIKEQTGVPIVFGGHHPTVAPEEVIRNNWVDFVVQGEGERAFTGLLEYLNGKRGIDDIPNLYYKDRRTVCRNELQPLMSQLDDLPFPDKEIFYSVLPYLSKTYTVMSSRGCPYSCSYCHNAYLHSLYQGKGPLVRTRSIENVIAELKAAKHRYACKDVLFQDEIFTLQQDWCRIFTRQYRREIGLPYSCYVHPNTLTEEMAVLLKESGCQSVNMGIESIDEDVRKRLLRRFIPQLQILKALRLLKEQGIYCRGYFIVGYPGQSEEDMRSLARFCNTHRFGAPMLFWIQYFPKTGLAEEEQTRVLNDRAFTGGYALGGPRENRRMQQLRFLVSISPMFSQQAVEYMIKRRLYLLFPPYNLVFFVSVVKVCGKLFKAFFGTKAGTSVPRTAFIPISAKYRHYLLRKFGLHALSGRFADKHTVRYG